MPDSWQKIARNFYYIALDKGFSGIEPNALDSEPQSQKKTIIYTAFIAENL